MTETWETQWRAVWITTPADHSAFSKAYVEQWVHVSEGEEYSEPPMYSNQHHHSRPSLLLDKRSQLFEQPHQDFLWRHPIICGTTFLTSDYFSRAPPTHRVCTGLCPQRLRFHPLPSTRIRSIPPCALRRGIGTKEELTAMCAALSSRNSQPFSI